MLRALLPVLLLAGVVSFAADIAGTYKGTWEGSAASGDITVQLTPADTGAYTAAVSFTLNGEDVKCKVTSVKVDGDNVELVYEFDLMDNRMQSTATGKLNGNSIEGAYKTKVLSNGAAVDEGSWKATRATA